MNATAVASFPVSPELHLHSLEPGKQVLSVAILHLIVTGVLNKNLDSIGVRKK